MFKCGAGEDVEHLLMTCGEFERNQWALTVVGAGESVARGIWKSVQGG